MGIEQRELVERAVMPAAPHGRAWTHSLRHTYVLDAERARNVQVGMIISTLPGAYWQVAQKGEERDGAVGFTLDALRPTDPRTHNGTVHELPGGRLV